MKRMGMLLAAIGLLSAFAVSRAVGQAGEDAKREPRQPGLAPRSGEGLRGGERGPFGRGLMGGGGMQDVILDKIVNDATNTAEIGLSAEQIKTLKDSLAQMKTQREELQKQLREAMQQQEKLMNADSVDETAALAGVEKTAQVRLEMDKAQVKFRLLVKKTLTLEQTNKINEMTTKKIQEMMQQQGRGNAGKERGKSDKEVNKTQKPAGE